MARKVSREIGRMSARTVASALKKPGLHPDGGGLYLQVGATGSASWIYRYKIAGRERQMGLGPANVIGLAEARLAVAECRRQRWAGRDPIDERRAARQTVQLERARGVTFRAAAELYISSHAHAWRNAKHGAQWRATLAAYAFPVFGDMPVQDIDVALVMKAIEPIWNSKSQTAARVRGRIESILDWAATRGYRKGENPARWRGHLDNLLPAPSKVAKVEHHPALSYSDIGGFMTELRKQHGTAAAALEFTVLTAGRTAEVLGAKWHEVNVDEALWIIPADRMKSGKDHRVPLSEPSLVIVRRMAEDQQAETEHVFPGVKSGRALSPVAMLRVLRRMDHTGLSVHGFRSTFRDWAAERTNFPHEIAEAALAHATGGAVERAYRRGDAIEKRRALMAAWAGFCSRPMRARDGNVGALVPAGAPG
jgi:integrase